MVYEQCQLGCGKETDKDHFVYLKEPPVMLHVCGLWRHYAEVHNVYPQKDVRDLVMGAPDIDASKIPHMEVDVDGMEGVKAVPVLFVKKKGIADGVLFGGGYDHEIGHESDWDFIKRLQELIDELGEEVLYAGV